MIYRYRESSLHGFYEIRIFRSGIIRESRWLGFRHRTVCRYCQLSSYNRYWFRLGGSRLALVFLVPSLAAVLLAMAFYGLSWQETVGRLLLALVVTGIVCFAMRRRGYERIVFSGTCDLAFSNCSPDKAIYRSVVSYIFVRCQRLGNLTPAQKQSHANDTRCGEGSAPTPESTQDNGAYNRDRSS